MDERIYRVINFLYLERAVYFMTFHRYIYWPTTSSFHSNPSNVSVPFNGNENLQVSGESLPTKTNPYRRFEGLRHNTSNNTYRPPSSPLLTTSSPLHAPSLTLIDEG